jgi:hypothetical protein
VVLDMFEAPGQEQVLGAVGAPRHAKADGKHHDEVDGNDRDINGAECDVLDVYRTPSVDGV